MRLGQVLLLQLLTLSATHISQASGQGWSGGSGSTQTGSGSVGDGSVAVILPVDSLQDQLLTTRGIDPDSLVRVVSSYGALGEGPEAIGQVETANTTVFTSVLIVPMLANASSIPLNAGEGPFESATADADELPGRTQIMYNCTSTSSLWNLLDDANVLRLEDFQQLEGNGSGDAGSPWSVPQVDAGSSENVTEAARMSVAIANVAVTDCLGLHNTSVGRVVVGNSFFGGEFSNSSAYFYVLNSSVSDDTGASTLTTSSSPSSGSCLLRLEMARATLAEVYPRCSIKFHSTDMSNLIRNTPVVSSEVVGGANETDDQAQARRLLDTSSFAFIKDPACSYECGEGGSGIEKDQCWAYINNMWYQLQCKMQFYALNSACDYECGNYDLPASQCYDCYTTGFSCAAGYSSSGWSSCCRILSCPAIADTTVASPKGLTWNLKDDAKTINQSNYPIYQTGDCSNPSDPSTTCCRITCENCFLNFSIASMFSDVDVYPTQFDVEMASELRLTGNSDLNVKFFAPNGCTLLDMRMSLVKRSLLIYGVPDISDISIDFAVDLGAKLSLKPHGTTVVFGATTAIHNFTAGTLNSNRFYSMQMTNQPYQNLTKNGLDVNVELDLIPSVMFSATLLDGLAKLGLKADIVLFGQLNASIKYPEPFPGLSTEYLDPTSRWHGGNCRLPHFMKYNGSAGYRDVRVSAPLSLGYDWYATDLIEYSPGWSSSKSIISGCIASSYDAKMQLSAALNAVSSLSTAKLALLQKIIGWALGMPDLDPAQITITVSNSTGAIAIQLSVPPVIGDAFPTVAAFEAEMYRRARTPSFSTALSNNVGVSIAAQCAIGWWGSACDHSCTAPNCNDGSASCNAMNGALTSCSSCKSGYWGATCSSQCSNAYPNTCVAPICNKDTGSISSCSSCRDGYWGDTCASQCYTDDNCVAPVCGKQSGAVTSCGSCQDGYWGDTCASQCSTNGNCVSPVCGKQSGAVTSCGSCQDGYWGDTCASQCYPVDNCEYPACVKDSGSTNSCGSCQGGYWGSTCENSCLVPDHCLNARCNQDSETAIECPTCSNGWDGTLCENALTPTAASGSSSISPPSSPSSSSPASASTSPSSSPPASASTSPSSSSSSPSPPVTTPTPTPTSASPRAASSQSWWLHLGAFAVGLLRLLD